MTHDNKSHRIDELFDNGYGYTPLHYAAANGSMNALEYLLEKGA
ncbi:MAG: ankyrin repeat domain-containing protein, partial [Chloroflexi bacterium]|nr:ankyrin repeat domain-containing protein [Chloroflexota bacterium]